MSSYCCLFFYCRSPTLVVRRENVKDTGTRTCVAIRDESFSPPGRKRGIAPDGWAKAPTLYESHKSQISQSTRQLKMAGHLASRRAGAGLSAPLYTFTFTGKNPGSLLIWFLVRTYLWTASHNSAERERAARVTMVTRNVGKFSLISEMLSSPQNTYFWVYPVLEFVSLNLFWRVITDHYNLLKDNLILKPPDTDWQTYIREGVGRVFLYLFCPGKSAFFNIVVTESDLDTKVRKMPITF